MGGLITFGAREVSQGWRWIDRDGIEHAVDAMPTRHLFHTFRMIWNNFMPASARVGAVRLYRFTGVHNDPVYLRDAIATIGRELARRTDLLPEWSDQLSQMARHFMADDAALLSKATGEATS